MQEIIKLGIGLFILVLAFPIGIYLAKSTKEELSSGQRWFKLIIVKSFLGSIISLILKNDVLFFGLLFITIVTSKSLRKQKANKHKS